MDTDTELTVAEVFDFFSERSATEEQNFADRNDKNVPDHAEALVANSATDLLKTVTSIDMKVEMADDGDDLPEEEMADSLAEAVVDLLAAVGTLKYERDIDISGAVKDRIEFMKDFEKFEEAMQAAETEQEQMEAIDEHLTEEIEKQMGMQQSPSVGDNVDSDDYEPDGVSRSFQ